MNAKSLQEEVTNEIIKSLEEGVKPWVKPWQSIKSQRLLPYNLQTKKDYSGFNVLRLWLKMLQKNYTSNGWITFKQAQKLSGHVVKGEKGTGCLYYDLIEVEDENSEDTKLVPFAKNFVVFNLDQIYGGDFVLPVISNFDIDDRVKQIIKATNVVIEEGHRAYYNPNEDFILLPPKSAFEHPEDYYATLFHELVHWTAHATRLNRLELVKSKQFGDESYAFEELVAELGSAFLCAELGIIGNYKNHASYIDSWLKLLKSNQNAVLKAASLASKAHKYLLPSLEEEQSTNIISASLTQPCNINGFSNVVTA